MLPSDEQFILAMKLYNKIYGNFAVTTYFQIPSNDSRWPLKLQGLPLGQKLSIYHNRYIRGELKTEVYEQLLAMGYHFDSEEIQWNNIIVPSLRTYKRIYGDLIIPRTFQVPSTNNWLPIAWGYKLGKAFSAMQNQQLFLRGRHDRREELGRIGFLSNGYNNTNDEDLRAKYRAAVKELMEGSYVGQDDESSYDVTWLITHTIKLACVILGRKTTSMTSVESTDIEAKIRMRKSALTTLAQPNVKKRKVGGLLRDDTEQAQRYQSERKSSNEEDSFHASVGKQKAFPLKISPSLSHGEDSNNMTAPCHVKPAVKQSVRKKTRYAPAKQVVSGRIAKQEPIEEHREKSAEGDNCINRQALPTFLPLRHSLRLKDGRAKLDATASIRDGKCTMGKMAENTNRRNLSRNSIYNLISKCPPSSSSSLRDTASQVSLSTPTSKRVGSEVVVNRNHMGQMGRETAYNTVNALRNKLGQPRPQLEDTALPWKTRHSRSTFSACEDSGKNHTRSGAAAIDNSQENRRSSQQAAELASSISERSDVLSSSTASFNGTTTTTTSSPTRAGLEGQEHDASSAKPPNCRDSNDAGSRFAIPLTWYSEDVLPAGIQSLIKKNKMLELENEIIGGSLLHMQRCYQKDLIKDREDDAAMLDEYRSCMGEIRTNLESLFYINRGLQGKFKDLLTNLADSSSCVANIIKAIRKLDETQTAIPSVTSLSKTCTKKRQGEHCMCEQKDVIHGDSGDANDGEIVIV